MFFIIIATLAALGWTFVTVMANGMSDAPTQGFQGGGLLIAIWAFVALLIVARFFNWF